MLAINIIVFGKGAVTDSLAYQQMRQEVGEERAWEQALDACKNAFEMC